MRYLKYVIVIVLSILIIIQDRAKKRKYIRIKRGSKLHLLDNKIINRVDKLLSKNKFIYRYKMDLVRRLNLVNDHPQSINENLATFIIGMGIAVFVTVSIVFFFVFKLWYIFLTLGVLAGYLFVYAVNMSIAVRRRKIQKEFPEALQVFIDMYITNKNIRTTLMRSYKKMPKQIKPAFERLSRSLSSSHRFEEYILDFAKSLDYVWGYAFAELLIISYEGAGDIDEELLLLNELVNDDILAEEETSGELAQNKTLFFIINIATLITFIFNIVANPIGKEIYFYTTTGGNLILIWVITVVIGIVTSHLMEQL